MNDDTPTRRRLLATLGASLAAGAAGLSGCLGEGSNDDGAGGGSPTDAPPPTRSPSGTAPTDRPTETRGSTTTGTTGGVDVVREVAVVPELVAPNSPDSYGVYGDRGSQYVIAVLDYTGMADPPTVEDISLTTGGDSYPFANETGYGSWALFDYGEAYSPEDNRSGWVVAEVPKPLDTGSVAVTWPGGRHPLGDEALAELRRPPASFAVRSFEAPETADPGERVTATVTVENTSAVDGTFVGAFNRSGPWIAYVPEAGIRLPVAAGETATWTYEHTVRDRAFSEDRPMRLHLLWREDSLTRTVTVQATATDSTGDPATPTATDATDTATEPDDGSDTPTATEGPPTTSGPTAE